jgi:transcriptional regulator GlxA family with amidase domain
MRPSASEHSAPASNPFSSSTSPAERLRAIRLTQARHALIEARISGNKIADVARLSGYENKSQFSRDYKAYFHESPTATLRAAFG